MDKNVRKFIQLLAFPLKNVFRSSLLRSAGTYGFFSLLNNAIPFFLLPLLTRFLSPADFGYIAMFGVMVNLTVPFVGLNGYGAYSRAYFAEDRFDHTEYMGTILLFIFMTGVVLNIFFSLYREEIGRLLSFPIQWMWTIPVLSMAIVVVQLILKYWQVRENPKPYGMFQNSLTLVEASLAIIFIITIGMGWVGRIISRTFATCFFALLGLWILKKNQGVTFKFNRQYLKHALFFGIPLIPHSLGGMLNVTIDRIFITKMVGVSETGLYSVGYQIGSILVLLATAFNQAYSPWLFKKLNEKNPKYYNKIVKNTYVYFVLILSLAVIMGALAPIMLKILVGVNFQGSSIFIIWIALGASFRGMYYMVVNYIFYVEKTYILAMVTFLGAIFNVVLNYFFIKYNGAIGAAQATTLTHFITFLVVWLYSAKVYPMPWKKFFRDGN
ncbi:MAG: lipopolysaccharide biosynthesis protein [Aminobacterium colombiense]|uniref:lipopolysaccharide biosynthesis protein n=1 Tax=Aminobacterium colombiense TaxID=81468 RepID=UPI003D9720B9